MIVCATDIIVFEDKKVATLFNACIEINISSVVEFQRWWVLKSKIFAVW